MNYEQTLAFLYSQLPMFQRIGPAAYKADLNNTYAILNVLGNPEKNFTSIHIGGTNGKGSVAHIMASILQESGYKTALYTSPHLVDFRERILLNGQKIPEEFVFSFIEKYKQEFLKIRPSFFEITVGMAFKYFEKEQPDIAIIEVGMGGRLDSTNVIDPLFSVITNISLDHTMFLGNSIQKIAGEKAAIIKQNKAVVIGEKDQETELVFRDKATDMNAEIIFAEENYMIKEVENNINSSFNMVFNVYKNNKLFIRNILCPLTADYQKKNFITVFQAVELIKRRYSVKKKQILSGFKNVIANTGIKGRWQIINRSPLTICDTGHNEAGIKNIVDQLRTIQFNKLHLVLGTVNDKDLDKILALLPQEAVYYFCKANIPRGLDQYTLAKKAKKHKLNGKAYNSVKQAFEHAKETAKKEDVVFIGGSTFVVAEVLQDQINKKNQ